MLKSESLHHFFSQLLDVLLFVCFMSFNVFTASAVSFFRCQARKKSCYLQRCEEVVLFKDTGAIAVLGSSHCLWNVRRISLLPGAFSFLEHFSKISLLSSRRFFLVTVADLRAHPIGSAGPSSSNDMIKSPSAVSGTTPAPCSNLAAYITMAMSYRISCSRAYLCVSQSRCFSNDEYCWKDLTHPSSGQWNSTLLFSLLSSSLSFSVAEANSVVCFGRCLPACLNEAEGYCLLGENCSRVQMYRNQFHTLAILAYRRYCIQCC